MQKFIILALLTISTNLMGADCVGPKDAKNGVVYLHGMDTFTPNKLELANRTVLQKISKELNITIALPRAKDSCPTQKDLYCWGWDFNDTKAVDSALSEVQSAIGSCFPNAKKIGLVGFSNGGYVVNYALKSCKKTGSNWSISIGAGSTWSDNVGPDLSECGKYVFMVGKDDPSLSEVKKMSPWLTQRKVDFEIIEFNGEHAVPYEELKAEIQSQLADQ